MSILVNITQAEIRDAQKELNGRVLTRPSQLLTDGISLIYVVDVEIGEGKVLKNVPVARANRELIYADVGSAVRLRRTDSGGYEVVGFSKEVPGTYIRVPVTIAPFRFGDAGTLSGSAPGSIITPLPPIVAPIQIVIGDPVDATVTSRLLTYSELSSLGSYGTIPYGAVGIFEGGVLQEITA